MSTSEAKWPNLADSLKTCPSFVLSRNSRRFSTCWEFVPGPSDAFVFITLGTFCWFCLLFQTSYFLQIQQMNGRSTHLDNSFYHNHYDLKWTKEVSAPSNLKDYFKTDCRHRNCHTTQIRFVVCVSYMTDIAAVDLYLRLIMINILLLLFCSAAWVGYTIHQQFALNYQT